MLLWLNDSSCWRPLLVDDPGGLISMIPEAEWWLKCSDSFSYIPSDPIGQSFSACTTLLNFLSHISHYINLNFLANFLKQFQQDLLTSHFADCSVNTVCFCVLSSLAFHPLLFFLEILFLNFNIKLNLCSYFLKQISNYLWTLKYPLSSPFFTAKPHTPHF